MYCVLTPPRNAGPNPKKIGVFYPPKMRYTIPREKSPKRRAALSIGLVFCDVSRNGLVSSQPWPPRPLYFTFFFPRERESHFCSRSANLQPPDYTLRFETYIVHISLGDVWKNSIFISRSGCEQRQCTTKPHKISKKSNKHTHVQEPVLLWIHREFI